MNADNVLERALLVKDVMDSFIPEANTPDGLIPNSWVDDKGIRHAMIWQDDIDSYMRITKQGDDWVLIDLGVF